MTFRWRHRSSSQSNPTFYVGNGVNTDTNDASTDGDSSNLVKGVALGLLFGLCLPLVIIGAIVIWRRRKNSSRRPIELKDTKEITTPTTFSMIPNEHIRSMEVIGKGFFGEVRRGDWKGVQGTTIRQF